MVYICYNCLEIVTLEELKKVDAQIDNLDEAPMTQLMGEFMDCHGPTFLFHDDGIVNCCQSCFNTIVDF